MHGSGRSVAHLLTCVALLIVNDDQTDWEAKVPQHKAAAVLTRPVSLKKVCEKIEELSGGQAGAKA